MADLLERPSETVLNKLPSCGISAGLSLGSGQSADVTRQTPMGVTGPLLAVVVPTLRRRLRDQWAGERPLPDDSAVRMRTPLRDFVPGNLFDDLLVPDVEFDVPSARNENAVEHLPALRTIREFLPGNVSRHFGVWASNNAIAPYRARLTQTGRTWSTSRHAAEFGLTMWRMPKASLASCSFAGCIGVGPEHDQRRVIDSS